MIDEPEAIKIVLFGNQNVGKTKIISRYIGNDNENNSSNIGANYSEKTIKRGNKKYELNIWDAAGHEQFHSLWKDFYKDSNIICFIYDITNQDSLDCLESIWYPD